MKQFADFKKMKGTEKGSRENRLSPVTISGAIVPWKEMLGDGSRPEYKLVCGTGTEYLILENSQVRDVLPLYCWKEVKIVGLLDKSNRTLIPQKVFPKGPDGESSNVIDLSFWKSQSFRKKVLHKINEHIIIPAAIFMVLAS